MKLKRIEKTINSTGDIHTITFEDQLRPRTPPGRKPGRPKFKWAEKGIVEYWESIRKQFKYTPLEEYDPNNLSQKEFITTYASATIRTPQETWSQIKNTEPKWRKDKTKEPIEEETTETPEELRMYTDGSCPENTKATEKIAKRVGV